MGFFSWITKDTKKSIANLYSNRKIFKVYMHDHNGNVWEEDEYAGYGIFGGKDYYILLAEMNGIEEDTEYKLKKNGIILAYSGKIGIIFPQLTESPDPPHKDDFQTECPVCNHQGYFY